VEEQRQPRLLIVDDEPGIRALLALVFTNAGYAVCAAGNADEALAACAAEPFNVVLSDVRMPGRDGHELMREVVQRYPTTRTVLMSGYDDIQCRGCGYASVPCVLLQKPFNPKEVVSLIDEIVGRETVSNKQTS
jgi:DNA-binding NtrC family response regulator